MRPTGNCCSETDHSFLPNSCCVIGVILIMSLPSAARGIDDNDRFSLSNQTPPTSTQIGYKISIDGKVMTPSPAGMQKFDLASTGRFEFQQHRRTTELSGPASISALRVFDLAGTETIVGQDHRTAIRLPRNRAKIRIYGRDNQLVSFCDKELLSRNELDLIQMPFDPLALQHVLPLGKVAVEETWNTDAWVMPMLTGIETAIDQSATCTLKSLTPEQAVITFTGKIEGAVRGSAANVTYSGQLSLDRNSGLITSFKGQQKEKRTAGPVSPGLDITANVTWTQAKTSTRSVTIDAITPDPKLEQLQFTTPQRLSFRHSREWHLFHQTGSVTMLRQIRNGELISQCNISTQVTVPPNKFTPDEEFRRDVLNSVSDREGELISEKTIRQDDAWRIRHIRTKGAAEKETIFWDHYLCSAASGEQFTLLFSHLESDQSEFGPEAKELLATLRMLQKR